MKTCALITIGQAPRVDIADVYDLYFKDQANIKQIGLLDSMTKEEIDQRYAWDHSTEVLTTTLRDGSQVILDHQQVQADLLNKIESLKEASIDIATLLCTAEFPQLMLEGIQVIEPEEIIIPKLKSEFQLDKMGIIVPLEDQIASSSKKWGIHPDHFAHASPYQFKEEAFKQAALNLSEKKLDVIVLDCMGYNLSMKVFLEELLPDLSIKLSNEIFFEELAFLLNGEE